MIKFIKKPIFIISLIITVGLAYYFYSTRDKGPIYETVIAKRGDVLEEVSVTGNVKPAEEVTLSFEKGGKVSDVYADVGEKVYTGETLVALDKSELQTQLAQAEADLKVQEIKVENAKADLEEAKKNIIDKIQDAYTKSDDAVRTKVDQFVDNTKGSYPQLKFSSLLEVEFNSGRNTIEKLLVSWKESIDTLSISNYDTSYSDSAKDNLNKVKSFLEKAAAVLSNILQPDANTNTWKTDVSTARTNVNTAITNISAAEEKLKTEGATLSLEEAQILSNKASVENYKAQLNKTVLYSPINGIITQQNIEVGEVVAPNASIIGIISENEFEVEANVPEADIAKVSIASSAKITLDAYGDEIIFEAKVVAIDPAETIIEGVTTYKVTIQFMKDDARIKSGMTANIDIQGRNQENVIVIPQQAVITKDGDKIVKVLRGTDVQEVKVEAGLRGSDGNVAILKGLSEGDEVILFEK